jgi:hypothetical protein
MVLKVKDLVWGDQTPVSWGGGFFRMNIRSRYSRGRVQLKIIYYDYDGVSLVFVIK